MAEPGPRLLIITDSSPCVSVSISLSLFRQGYGVGVDPSLSLSPSGASRIELESVATDLSPRALFRGLLRGLIRAVPQVAKLQLLASAIGQAIPSLFICFKRFCNLNRF